MDLTAAEIARLVGGEVQGDAHCRLRGVNTLEAAGPRELSFYHNPKYARQLAETRAGCVLIPADQEYPRSAIRCAEPYLAFARVLELLAADRRPPAGVSPLAAVDPAATLGPDASIAPFAVIEAEARLGARAAIGPHAVVGRGAVLGDDVTLHPGVVLYPGTVVGDRVIIHAGAVLGSDGFGYAFTEGRHRKIPQVGRVRLEDDVEIGAGTTIDCATLGETVVGAGSKIDNLVQIGHNVQIGPHSVLAAQTGIAGSARLGAHAMLGGKAGVNGHVTMGDRLKVAAMGGVAKSGGDDVAIGFYGIEQELWVRVLAALRRLPRMREELRELQQLVRRRADTAEAAPGTDDAPAPRAADPSANAPRTPRRRS